MANALPDKSLDAQNFLGVLGLIDRTVLARRLLLSNGAARLVLIAARRCAALPDGAPDSQGASAQSLMNAIGRLCAAGRPVTYRVEPAAEPSPGKAFPAIAIVNAQDRPEAREDDADFHHYRFFTNGWPIAAPMQGSFSSLEKAAKIAWSLLSWQSQQEKTLNSRTMILAISDSLPYDISITVNETLTFASTPSARLGQLVSLWRNRPSEGSPG
ncbi:MAG: hypothetical protein HC850_02320 [Rhodomicrobium sp.]|nr:hypothetical protein [Rhodomicrobium sp.]